MNLSFSTQEKAARVGNLYGWALRFLENGLPDEEAVLTISSNDYHASVEATLPNGLNGGRVKVVIDALEDKHYGIIRSCAAADLYLFWQDANPDIPGFLANTFGLGSLAGGPPASDLEPAFVLRFAYEAKRLVGKKCYETVLEGGDNAFHRLVRARAPRACFTSIGALLDAIGTEAGVSIIPEPNAATLLGQTLQPEDEQTGAANPRESCADALRTIASRIAAGSRASPRIPALRTSAPSVVLLRDGKVHIGRRMLPFPVGSVPKVVDAENGLIEAARHSDAGPTGHAENRTEGWTLTCRGRPDIRTGDILQFKKPPEDVISATPDAATALFGNLAGPILGAAPEPPDGSIIVTEVAHSMSRTGGFSSRVTGIEIPLSLPMDPWTLFHTASGLEEGTERRIGTGSGDPATAIARQVRDLARAAVGRIRLTEVAEVRSVTSEDGSPQEPPAQTVTVWEGTDGRGNQHASRRLPIRREDPYERRGVGTVTPFAWGKCGLAVPRYPGMRVMLGYVNGQSSDPVDLGAIWGPDARMNSKPGDWWLKLPTGQSTTTPDDTAEHLPSGDVVNDLTDAAGVRIIEVGKLTVRVGAARGMDERPEHTADEAISIEHSDGKASIRMDQDGKIIITGKDISIDAGTQGTVSIKAKSVNVAVSDKMKVGGT